MAFTLPPSGEAGDDRYQPLAEINVTPMVDVMLVLLIIFMVTAPLLTVGVPLDLPKTTAAEVTQPKEPIVLSLDREGGSFIGNEPVAAADLKAKTSALHSNRGWTGPSFTFGLATAGDTFPILSADDESSALDCRNDHNTMCIVEKVARNPAVGCGHDLFKYRFRF